MGMQDRDNNNLGTAGECVNILMQEQQDQTQEEKHIDKIIDTKEGRNQYIPISKW